MNGIACAFQGRIGSEPSLKFTATGKVVLTFSVAVEQGREHGSPEPPPAEWVRVSFWEQLAESLGSVLSKGSEVYCEGRVKLATWTGPDGSERHGLNVSAWTVQPLGAIGRRAASRAGDAA